MTDPAKDSGDKVADTADAILRDLIKAMPAPSSRKVTEPWQRALDYVYAQPAAVPSVAHPVPSDAPALAGPDYASAIAAGWAKVERDPSPDRCEEGPVWYHAELDRAMPLDTSCRDLCREVGADEEEPADPVKADMLVALKRLAEIIRDRHRLHGEDIGYTLASLKDAEAIIARAKGEA